MSRLEQNLSARLRSILADLPTPCDDGCMNIEQDNASAGALADLEAVLQQIDQGNAKDPRLMQRIEERSRAIRQRVLAEHGLLNVAVDLVRETRDE